ncbi:MAG: HNH endonuclease, partial [Calditrichaeota bacterium]|nr:HNH endonuclease [Calditrichota bacterium]
MIKRNAEYYLKLVSRLRRDYKKGGAPHKPILLISIIKGIEKGFIKSEKINITPELVGLFKQYWNKLVTTEHHPIFSLPFYHMKSEPFWKLVPKPGCESWVNAKSTMRSFSNLNTAVDYAQIDIELFSLLNTESDRLRFFSFLIEKYFPAENISNNSNDHDIFYEISHEINSLKSSMYREKILKFKTEMDPDSFQEEVYVRSGLFKCEISKIYN